MAEKHTSCAVAFETEGSQVRPNCNYFLMAAAEGIVRSNATVEDCVKMSKEAGVCPVAAALAEDSAAEHIPLGDYDYA
jgi:hypothetical protein